MDLTQYLSSWKLAMKNGEIGNHPFSALTVNDYVRRVELFLAEYGNIEFQSVKTALRAIPIEQPAKHKKLYSALVCFVKFLHSEGEQVDKRLLVINKKTPDELAIYKRPANKNPVRTTVSALNMDKLKAACISPFELLFVTLLATTGLRVSEACGIKMHQVDCDNGTIWQVLGKGNKKRDVPITKSLNIAILKYLVSRPSRQPDDQFLQQLEGQQFNRFHGWRLLKAQGDFIGAKVTPHSLRRAFVTIAHAKGAPLDYLRRVCGHTDMSVTQGYCQSEQVEVFDYMRNLDL